MSKLVTPLEATIEFITDLKEGQYGVYKSVLFQPIDGSEKIWKSFPPDSPDLAILQKGARVRLIPNGSTRSGKPSHVIELVDGVTPSPQPKPTMTQPSKPLPTKPVKMTDLTDDQKRQAAAYIEQMGAMYRFAYGQATHHLKGMTDDPSTMHACASTLFIAAQRKFNL